MFMELCPWGFLGISKKNDENGGTIPYPVQNLCPLTYATNAKVLVKDFF